MEFKCSGLGSVTFIMPWFCDFHHFNSQWKVNSLAKFRHKHQPNWTFNKLIYSTHIFILMRFFSLHFCLHWNFFLSLHFCLLWKKNSLSSFLLALKRQWRCQTKDRHFDTHHLCLVRLIAICIAFCKPIKAPTLLIWSHEMENVSSFLNWKNGFFQRIFFSLISEWKYWNKARVNLILPFQSPKEKSMCHFNSGTFICICNK